MEFLKIAQPSEICCPDPSESGPRNFIGNGAAYFAGTTLCWVTLAAWYEDWGDLSLELECDGPHPEHWFAYETDCTGLDEMFGLDAYGSDEDERRERWMIELGVAPGQRFRIAATYHTHKSWTDYGYEYDAEIDWEVIAIEPWTNEQIVAAWDEYFEWKKKCD